MVRKKVLSVLRPALSSKRRTFRETTVSYLKIFSLVSKLLYTRFSVRSSELIPNLQPLWDFALSVVPSISIVVKMNDIRKFNSLLPV